MNFSGIDPVLPTNGLPQDSPLAQQLQSAIADILPDELAAPSSSSSTQSRATSPSAPSITSSFGSSPPTPHRPIPNFTLEKESLLGDLSHFIPVGILKRCDELDNNHEPSVLYQALISPYPSVALAQLEQNNWIRTSICRNKKFPGWSAVRIYVLPDDIGRKHIHRSSGVLRGFLKSVMSKVDTSAAAWEGDFDPYAQPAAKSAEVESLFYIFNTLELPTPDVDKVSDPHARAAIEDVLWKEGDYVDGSDEDIGVVGLKTPLYAYQRRSAAYMIQRESHPAQMLDPRLQALQGPTGQTYYYDKEEGSILREKRLYSEACGGILAETMGYGKTLICLAVILATRGHFPRIPIPCMEGLHPVREKTASLLDMAAATAGRFSLPWKSYFERLEASGMHFEKCISACESNRVSYEMPRPPQRYRSREATFNVTPAKLRLCSGTLIVVPPNLIDHWLSEIDKHTQGLKVLVLRDSRRATPPAEELLAYDILLFSKSRFEKEAGDSGRSSRSATGPQKDYPLKRLHWLRIIVDEGHNFTAKGARTTAVHALGQLQVERRWVVSGTPSRGLYGIEVALASQESAERGCEEQEVDASSILQARKSSTNVMEEELKNIDKLRSFVVDFLALKPWSNSKAEDPASWAKYIKPLGLDGNRRTSPSLRSTLQSLVVRHRAEYVNRELTLPQLHNKVAYLEPTFYDKMSLNLHIFTLTVNVITSERTGEDYMFHPKNRKHLAILINNLRRAGFWVAGFEKNEVQKSIDLAREYLEKNFHRIDASDKRRLSEGVIVAEKAINCSSWDTLSKFTELGVFLDEFPEHARAEWAIDANNGDSEPLLLGISQARHAQKFVASHLCACDPSEGIAGAGIRVRSQMQERGNVSDKKSNDNLVHQPKPEAIEILPSKKSFSLGRVKKLSPESPLNKTKLVATASAKLTYLLDKVLEFQEQEKIIIFYEGNNTGYWIAEGLELLGVEFRIYANTLKPQTRSEYLSLFNETETVRVLLMDLRQASHGLHIASASRVFIVNPIWDPNIESQAIKRAHRISQTKPVYVETLVLKGTLEDRMLRRRKQMSNAELRHAEKDPLDDQTMSFIIQNEQVISLPENNTSEKPAYLKVPVGFFDRHTLPIPDDYQEAEAALPMSLPPPPSVPEPVKVATPTKKRKPTNDLPWIESDVQPSSKSGPITRKQRRLNEHVETPDGIIMEAPRTRTPPSRRNSAPRAMLHTNESASPALNTHALLVSYDGPSDTVEDAPRSEEEPVSQLFENLSPFGASFFGAGKSFLN
ncbi:nicotinamide riboside kinase [Blastomyces parvus]|uniref:Nicotinamide riboside kinase n=1 Tax=Blastomyces parvus TaxID=2060905 RepID=A0A2B7WR74_9EURO|nr:nicotinamide riboside kinase [Blastomyces parvus]